MSRRRHNSEHGAHINEAAIEAFRAGDDDALRAALGLKPWEFPSLPPLDRDDPGAPGTAGAIWWPRGQALHRALIAATRGQSN